MLASAGLATFLLLWLTVIRGISASNSLAAGISSSRAFLAREASEATPDGTVRARLTGLTISTITTNVVSVATPFLVSLAAYCFAGILLAQQEETRNSRIDQPTPLQYGLLVKLLGSSGLLSLWQAFKYLVRSRNRRAALPSHLISAFMLTATIYAISHLISLADLWLHAASFATLGNTTTPLLPPTQHGATFNQSLCSPNFPLYPCLVEGDGCAITRPDIVSKGMLIATNSSASADVANVTPLSVITLADFQDLAIIVPTHLDPSFSFEAPSFGIRAQCSNLTPKCLSSPPSGTFNCSAAGYPQLPFNGSINGGNIQTNDVRDSRVLSLINGTLVGERFGAADAPPLQYPSNPQTVLLQLVWSLNQDDIGSVVSPNKVVYEFSGQLRAWTACDMSFFNVTIRYSGGRFGVVGEPQRTIPLFTGAMWAPLLHQITNLQLLSNLESRTMAIANDDSFLAAINQELSRISLGAFGGAPIPAPTTSLFQTYSAFIGCYPVAPVLTYVGLLYVHSIITLGVFIMATSISYPLIEALPDGKPMTTLQLTKLHLTDPLTLVARIFPSSPGSNAHRSVQPDPVDMFMDDDSSPRLQVGINTSKTSGAVFGIYTPQLLDQGLRRRSSVEMFEGRAGFVPFGYNLYKFPFFIPQNVTRRSLL